jgi:hypothetical protein
MQNIGDLITLLVIILSIIYSVDGPIVKTGDINLNLGNFQKNNHQNGQSSDGKREKKT